MIGEVVAGRYEVVRELGQGGMGAVFLARHTGSGRRVALKMILKGKDDPKLRARFLREAKAAGQLESRHVAQVLDVGMDDARDLPFIAMEFLEGEDLGAVLSRVGALPSSVVAKVGAQALVGLARAHAAGVVHRDIKPANLFLARQDDEIVVKLLDFGVAKLIDTKLDGEIERLTATGALLGSPLYMSPEQALGSKAIDERSDIWSLGVLLYEALTGTTPYGHCSAMGELLVEICVAPPPPVVEVAPWVDPRLSRVIEAALQLEPAKRTASAQEMADALRPLLPSGTSLRAEEIARDPKATELVPRERRKVAAASANRPSGRTTAAVASELLPPSRLATRRTLTGVGALVVLAAAGAAAVPLLVRDDASNGVAGAGEPQQVGATPPEDAQSAPARSAEGQSGLVGAPTKEAPSTPSGAAGPSVVVAPSTRSVAGPGASAPRTSQSAPAAAPSSSGRKNYGF